MPDAVPTLPTQGSPGVAQAKVPAYAPAAHAPDVAADADGASFAQALAGQVDLLRAPPEQDLAVAALLSDQDAEVAGQAELQGNNLPPALPSDLPQPPTLAALPPWLGAATPAAVTQGNTPLDLQDPTASVPLTLPGIAGAPSKAALKTASKITAPTVPVNLAADTGAASAAPFDDAPLSATLRFDPTLTDEFVPVPSGVATASPVPTAAAPFPVLGLGSPDAPGAAVAPGASLAHANTGGSGTSHGTPAASAQISVPLHQAGWDQAFAQRVVWLVKQDVQGAELHINPPQLGPLEMRVVLNNDQASVAFTAQHAAVREALEAAMPRLREMLSASGLNLADVNISQHSFAQQRQEPGYAPHTGFSRLDALNAEDEPLSNAIVQRSLGLVDFYA